jgi:flagellar basal body-associated protein FliL
VRRAQGAGDGPMIILLILVLLGLLLVAGFIAFEVIGEKKDETW